MKFFIVAALLVAAASADFVAKTTDEINAIRKGCIAENAVPLEIVSEFKNGVFPLEAPTPCYLRCVLTKLNVFDDTTGILTDNYILQLGTGETSRAGINGCIDNSGTDHCLWAYRAYTCLKKGNYVPAGY